MKTFLSPLNGTEEKEYLRRWIEGDTEAKMVLIEHNMRLVAHVSKKYQNAEEDMEDLISIGTIGLIKRYLLFGKIMAASWQPMRHDVSKMNCLCIFGQKRKVREKYPSMSRLEQTKKATRFS